MLVILIRKCALCKTVLSNNSINKSIIYGENKEELVKLEKDKNIWKIRSTDDVKIIKPKSVKMINGIFKESLSAEYFTELTLKEGVLAFIKLEKDKEICLIYCSKLYEKEYVQLKIKNTNQITVGKDLENYISYNFPLISNKTMKIYFLNGKCFLDPIKNNSLIYVNDISINNKSRILNNGDRIFILGLNIIYNNNSFFINNPFNKVKINSNYLYQVDGTNNGINFNNEIIFNNKPKYFIRPPRIIDLKHKNINIISPKDNAEPKNMPMILAMGSSLGMALMSLITAIQSIYNYANGKMKIDSLIFSLIMTFTMLISAMIVPIITRKATNKFNKRELEKKKRNYKKYIEDKMIEINVAKEEYRKNLYIYYPSAEECVKIAINQSARLWERKILDKDFLTVRLGTGKINSNIEIEDNNIINENNSELSQLMLDCIENAKTIDNAPILLSLKEKKIVGIISKDEKGIYGFMQQILAQIITFFSYYDLKLVFFLKKNPSNKMNYVKMFPHVWNNSKDIRFFANDMKEFTEISNYLMKELNKQKTLIKENKEIKTHFLIIVDDYKSVENILLIDEILNSEDDIDFSILFLTKDITSLPNACNTFIELNNQKAILTELKENQVSKSFLYLDNVNDIFFYQIVQNISNITMKYNKENENKLPETCTFLEMYDVNSIEELNIYDNWQKNDTTSSLAAAIGIDEAGNLINLDIHEKFHGPHGLIAGSTGSGKSEFIITYILSLIINYHPDDVTFVLIDYKGGGLANAFERENMKIPHLVGTITNIDKSGLQRSIESIESELKRRQIEFNKAKEITGESTIDIYKYQKYFHQGVLKKTISHLFIICDEFAELKQQEPEFMDKIISIARIGRSLGVHLILATQKPSGVVNDQIRSNTKFGICLKVQSKGDSSDVIGCGDAAMLKRAGQFYFKVGNDDYMTLGQSGWAGAEYTPGVLSDEKRDDYVEFISNTGETIKRVKDIAKIEKIDYGDQNTNIVKYICELAKKHNIREESLWLPNIPENIYLEELRKKYNVIDKENVIEPVIGEYDDPSHQIQNIIRLNLTKAGNTVIYGNAESGKESLIRTMVYDIMMNHSPNEVNIYIIDLGSEAMSAFKDIPQVGDVIFSTDTEKIYRFFIKFSKIISERKKELLKCGGDYQLYLKKKMGKMPLILTFINNYDSFVETFGGKYEDVLQTIIREGMSMGVIFVLTVGSSNSIRYRMQQNFKHKVVLRMTKDDDYVMLFDHLGSKRPSNLFGRGLIQLEDKKIYEYQMAKICKNEDWNDRIIKKTAILNKRYKERAKKVDILPNVLTLNNIKSEIKNIENVPVALSYSSLDIIKYNFKKDLLNVITGKNLEEMSDFILNFINELRLLKDIESFVLDSENIILLNQQDTKEEYISIFKNFREKKNPKTYIIIIIGLNKFINNLGGDDIFKGSLDEATKSKNINLIIFEPYKNFSQYGGSSWIKSYFNKENGIWIGPGIEGQYLFSLEDMGRVKKCTKSFGYVIKNGTSEFTKILGMQENKEGEDDE